VVSEEELTKMIEGWIVEHGQGQLAGRVNEDLDLLASGALDSMGFIELLAYIESVTGHAIDLTGLDADALTSVHGLVRNIVKMNTHA
jgi:acyl carrier protein